MPWITPGSNAPTSRICRRILIPDDPAWIAPITGALLPLTYGYSWEQSGSVTADDAIEVYAAVLNSFIDSSDVCMIGTVFAYITSDPPSGALPCDGSVYAVADYPELAAVLDPVYIAGSSFSTPDLRGRTIIGAGTGAGLTDRASGDNGGAESVTLVVEQLPSHTHTTQPHSHYSAPHSHSYTGVTVNIDVEAPGVPDPIAAGLLPFQFTSAESVSIADSAVTVDTIGNGDPVDIMPPFVALKYAVIAR